MLFSSQSPGKISASRSASSATRCQSTATAPSASRALTTFKQGITYTYYESNSFCLKFQATGVRVLVDPWLVDDLTFWGQDWLYRGKKRVASVTKTVDIDEVAAETDIILITQSLDDHCHLPTLRLLPKTIPVVAQRGAAEKARNLGFQSVQTLEFGQTLSVCEDRLKVTGTKGAAVGPPWSERMLGLVLRESDPTPAGQQPQLHHACVYYEPHCEFVESSVAGVGPVDVVISPVRSTLLGVGPASVPIVFGDINLTKLMQLLRPRVLVPLLNDEIDAEGFLSALTHGRGDASKAQEVLQRAGVETHVVFPAPPGEALSIAL